MKTLLKDFKNVLNDAAKTFGKKPYEVTDLQFFYLSKGRINHNTVKMFKYTALRDVVAPRPDTTKKQQTEARQMIERLLKNA